MKQAVTENYKALINNALANLFHLNKWRKDFIIDIFILFLSIKGRINFMQLGRYGKYGEQRYRQQFEQNFDFFKFNIELVIPKASKHCILGFDPSYIPKSGKGTYGASMFWSGCAQKARWGLEICGIAVLDIDNHTAFHLEAVQTPDKQTLESKSFTLLDFYASIFTERDQTLLKISKYVAADAYFSKKPFLDKLSSSNLHLISRLRSDSDLRYLYKGEPTGKQGRPKKYDGKVKFKELDLNYFDIIEQNSEHTLYCAIVNCKAFERNIKLVIMVNSKGKYQLYFSDDLELDGNLIYLYYHNRFQIEFLYRDGKQHTGLNDCQARNENKLNFHFNASLTSINIAKIAHWLSIEKEQRGAFSMADIKTVNHNILLLERFIEVFAVDADSLKNTDTLKELIYFGKIAA